MDNITQDKEIVKNMGKKCKWTAPNGPERECKPSIICGDCENNTLELKNAYEAGKMLQYQKENGEWVDFSKNTVCDDFKFQEHLNYRIKPAYNHKSFSDKMSDINIQELDKSKIYLITVPDDYGKKEMFDILEKFKAQGIECFIARKDLIVQKAERTGEMNYIKAIIKGLLDNSDEYARQRAEDFLKEDKN